MNRSFCQARYRKYCKTDATFYKSMHGSQKNEIYMPPMVSLRSPFNTKSWRGYSIVLVFESIGSYATCAAAVNFLCIFIGSSWILSSIAKDIINELHEWNMDAPRKTDQWEIQWRFCNISKRFAEAKQLSPHFLTR